MKISMLQSVICFAAMFSAGTAFGFDPDLLVDPKYTESTLSEITNERSNYIEDTINRTRTLPVDPNAATLLIFSNTYWSGSILDSDLDSVTQDGHGDQLFDFECSDSGNYSIAIQKQNDGGYLMLYVLQKGKILDEGKTDAQYGVVTVAGNCIAQNNVNINDSGGCLIATAAYGTELALQVQNLRDLRQNVLFSTNSGAIFMAGFNEFYYSFSPTVADWERQNPIFRDIVKITITPMLSTLSILNYVDIDSEQKILGYGIGIILLNIGIYLMIPMIVIMKLKHLIKHN